MRCEVERERAVEVVCEEEGGEERGRMPGRERRGGPEGFRGERGVDACVGECYERDEFHAYPSADTCQPGGR